MKKLLVILALLPFAAHAERKDFSASLAPKDRPYFTLEVDTDRGGFYITGVHGETFVDFSRTEFKNPPVPEAFDSYARHGGRFTLGWDYSTHSTTVLRKIILRRPVETKARRPACGRDQQAS